MSKDPAISSDILRARRIAFELDTLSPPVSNTSAPKGINTASQMTPPSLDRNLFRSDGNVHSLAPPRGRPGGQGSNTILKGESLYCHLPSDKISGEQLYRFLRIQFGVEIESPFPTIKV